MRTKIEAAHDDFERQDFVGMIDTGNTYRRALDPPTVLALISEIERLQGVIEDALAIHTGSNRSLYGNDFEAGMVKALWLVHKILDGEGTHEQP